MQQSDFTYNMSQSRIEVNEEIKADSRLYEGKRKPNTKVGRTCNYAPFEKKSILLFPEKIAQTGITGLRKTDQNILFSG